MLFFGIQNFRIKKIEDISVLISGYKNITLLVKDTLKYLL